MNQQAGPNIAMSLLATHAFISRGLEVSRESGRRFLERRATPEDSRDGFGDYTHTFSSILHAHHLGEDEVVFPYMKTVLPDVPYDKLSADHRVIEPLLTDIGEASGAFKSGDDGPLGKMLSALDTLEELWYPHIHIEESNFTVQLLGELIEPAEHARLLEKIAEFSMQNSGPDYLVVPFMLYDLDPEPRAMMAAALPPVVTEQLIPVAWKDRWAPMKPYLLD